MGQETSHTGVPEVKGRTVLVLGGARSGKSSFALRQANACGGEKTYIATCQPLDDEMRDRIERHRRERDEAWTTREEPLRIAAALSDAAGKSSVVVVDCLTLWLSNLLHAGGDTEEEFGDLITAVTGFSGLAPRSTLIIVSNEVGGGIVPGNELARRFRDLAGILNQKVAAAVDEVYLVVAGMPVPIKGKGGT